MALIFEAIVNCFSIYLLLNGAFWCIFMSHVNIYNQIIIYTITTILGIQPELCVIVKVSEEVIAGQIYTK